MSNPEAQSAAVTILGKEYMVACSDEERHDLIAAAGYLDKKMREIRDSGKVIGTDRIAVMAALNIAHELLSGSAPSSEQGKGKQISERVRSLQHRIEEALYRSRQLEI